MIIAIKNSDWQNMLRVAYRNFLFKYNVGKDAQRYSVQEGDATMNHIVS